jgi:hypothetical protein
VCGPSEARTHDLLNAIETRSQLRHGPLDYKEIFYSVSAPSSTGVDLAGFEPATSSVRLMRAPNCATGPYFCPNIVLEGGLNVNLAKAAHPD